MVMTVLLTNNARSTLLSGINALQTEIRLRAGGGNTFPTITAPGQWFPITIEDSLGNIEIMRVIARSGDVFTVKRAQEGTTAKSFSANDVVELRLTVGAMQELVNDTHTNFGRIYMTPAYGVDSKIGVPAGYYFNVRSPSDDSYVDEYQNVNGVAVATGKSYPSGELTQSMSEQIDKIGSLDYLSEQLDKIAVDKGWDVVYDWVNQKKINDGLRSISEMLAIQNPKNCMRVYVKSYHAGLRKGGGWFVYDQTKASTNDTGMVIDGWVRQLDVPPNPYHFGAYGDWNSTNQTGHDDSIPFQNCIDYILTNYTDYRGANSGRQLTLEIGSYLVGSLQFNGAGWSFRMVGQGVYTQLWHKKELGRHVVNLELTYFENIHFNGASKSAAEPADMVDYVFDFYLTTEALDIDTHFLNCAASNCKVFARVDGRGFKFTGGSLLGCKDVLLEIYCDPNATHPGSLPVHTVAASMRHYIVEGIRVDAGTGLIKVTGTGSQKDYINGITIRNSEIVGCYWLIDAPDATLVGLRIQNNYGIQCFPAWRKYGTVLCKGIVNAIDTDNNWNNYLDNTEEGSTDFRMAAMYRVNTIDGLTISKLRVKDSVYSIVRFVNSGNNIKVLDSTFKNFSPESTDGRIIWNESGISANATNVLISGNTVDSKTTKGLWMNNVAGSSTFKAVDNIYPVGFDDQRIPYNPKLLVNGAESGSVTEQYNKSYYEIDGNYINCYVEKGMTTTLTAGAISLQLPVAAVLANIGYSSLYSGSGLVDVLGGFAPNPYTIRVHAATEQRAILQLNGVDVNLSAKTGTTITVFCHFRYKFK